MSFADDLKWSASTHYIRGLRTVGPVTITGDWTSATLTTGAQSGTAGAGTTSTSIVKPAGSADWTADEMRTGNMFIRITSGGGSPAVRPIIDNGTTTITVQAITGADATSVFAISTVSADHTFTNLTLSDNLPEIIIDTCVIKKLTSSRNSKVTIKNCLMNTASSDGSIDSNDDTNLYISECAFRTASVRADRLRDVSITNSIFTGADAWAYFVQCNKVYTGINAESCSSTALHLDGCLYCHVGLQANSNTATPLHMESCGYCAPVGVGLIGTNAGATYGILMEKAGYYDLTSGTLAGASDLRLEDKTCTWAQLGTYKCITRKGLAILTTAGGDAVWMRELQLTLEGDLDVGGRVLSYGYWYPSARDGITAHAGGGLANATVLDRTFNVVDTCATDHDSVKLPSNPVGTSSYVTGPVMWVHNETAHILDIYPGDAAHQIGEGAAGTPVAISMEQTVGFWAESATKWHTFQQEPTWTTIDPAITAHAGGGLANAYPCICHYNIITTCANVGDSVRLVDHLRYDSASNQGFPLTIIHNNTPRRADVYPGTAAHQINALGAGVAFQLAANTTQTFIPTSSTQWISIR